MRSRPLQEIVTFKADQALLDALEGVDNRSEFIRAALLAALDNTCPLCKGRGLLTPNQKRHWSAFAANHNLTECGDCHELHLVCSEQPEPAVHSRARHSRHKSPRSRTSTRRAAGV